MKGDFLMIYLSSFKLSDRSIKNPNIYPYNVFHRKDIDPFVFAPITVLYGNNGSGKSTILNIIANKLMLTGKEYATSNSFGIVDYCGKFSSECQFSYGEDEFGNVFRRFPENSRFIKSEDILYEKMCIRDSTLSSVGSMIGPASMIVTGMLIAGMNLKEIFSRGRVYGIAFMRLIIICLLYTSRCV